MVSLGHNELTGLSQLIWVMPGDNVSNGNFYIGKDGIFMLNRVPIIKRPGPSSRFFVCQHRVLHKAYNTPSEGCQAHPAELKPSKLFAEITREIRQSYLYLLEPKTEYSKCNIHHCHMRLKSQIGPHIRASIHLKSSHNKSYFDFTYTGHRDAAVGVCGRSIQSAL